MLYSGSADVLLPNLRYHIVYNNRTARGNLLSNKSYCMQHMQLKALRLEIYFENLVHIDFGTACRVGYKLSRHSLQDKFDCSA